MGTGLTLRQAFEEFHLRAEHSPRSIEDYRTALSHWERCTSDPPIEQIDHLTLRAFRECFAAEPLPAPRHWSAAAKRRHKGRPPSRTTVAKVLRTLQAILSTVGPPRIGHPDAIGLLDSVPVCGKPRLDEPQVVAAEPDEVGRIYRAIEDVEPTWPRCEVPAVAWWQGLVVYLFNIGSRRNEFLALPRAAVDLSRKVITLQALKRGGQQQKPINATLAEHLRRIWDPARELLFPAPRNKRSLYRTFYAIQDAAGIHVQRSDDRRRPFYGFHELRKTCGTELFAIDPRAAQAMLGHASMQTTERFYTAARAIVSRSAAAAEQLQQPAAFGTVDADPPAPRTPPGRPHLRIVG